ncbi:MAG: protease pro-enzyme activation domain-containing protein [Bryobacteraceae bacterium]
MSKSQRCLALWAILGAASPAILAQPDRITARIDSNQSVVLSGRVPRQATAQSDAGAVAGSFPLPGITLMLKPSAAQQADLTQLLQAQQDPTSPSYRQWLTPDQYADRFGASAADLAKIAAWLESQGFTVGYVARAHNFISFSGTAQQVSNAFHTQIHRYNVNGETHYANATDPSIPAALAGLVSTIRGLNDFRLKPRFKKAQPQLVFERQTSVGPIDFATIYDINPLYSAGITGTGQKIAVVGQSAIVSADIASFRAAFSLGTANLTQVLVPGTLGGGNPGIVPGDETESDLDIEWSGAVAKNADIIFVYAANGAEASLEYAIDVAIAPVLSMSYGLCEEIDGIADVEQERAMAQQANSEGMTILAAAGDYAAADCDEWDNDPVIAEGGLAVDEPGSVPEITSMGGTEFNDESNPALYWGTNGAATRYIPEIVWNDTAAVGLLDGTGGGASVYFTQPPWQSNLGLTDGMRHVPDLSFPASNDHDPFYIYSSDTSNGPAGGQLVGGTSCAAPTMAGVVALLNQYLVSSGSVKQAGLGNINPTLYKLAQTQSQAFHDIVTGSNIVPCADSPDCINGSFGWAAGPGYDSASGLGSVDAYNLVHAWNTALATQAVVVASIDQNPVYETGSGVWTFTLTLTEEAGIATQLTGLTINNVTLSPSQVFTSTTIPANGTCMASPCSISATYSLRGLDVSNGPVNVPFTFSFASGANTTMTVPFAGSPPLLAVGGFSNAASGQVAFAPGMLISVYGSGMGNFVQSATVTPLPEYMAGFEAFINYGPGLQYQAFPPLLYVSPNQVNLQIPYEVSGAAELVVGNPFTNTTPLNFTVSSAAPGVFSYHDTSTNSSPIGSGSAKAGQEVAIYVTGVGHVSIPGVPGISDPDDGATPLLNSNPQPYLPVSITVGGVAVAQPYAYIGIPNWSVGVTQINFNIPSGVGTGPQPLVVTVGGVPSLPANITITQ